MSFSGTQKVLRSNGSKQTIGSVSSFSASSFSVSSSGSSKRLELSLPINGNSIYDKIYAGTKVKNTSCAAKENGSKEDLENKIYETAKRKRKMMMLKSPTVIGDDAFSGVPNNNYVPYSDSIKCVTNSLDIPKIEVSQFSSPKLTQKIIGASKNHFIKSKNSLQKSFSLDADSPKHHVKANLNIQNQNCYNISLQTRMTVIQMSDKREFSSDVAQPMKNYEKRICSRVQAGPVQSKVRRKKVLSKSFSLDQVSNVIIPTSSDTSANEFDSQSQEGDSSLDDSNPPDNADHIESNRLTVKAEIHEECKSFVKEDNIDIPVLDHILDDSSMYNEDKLARLASIDELIEYEEEIADLAENFDKMNIL